MYGFHRMERWLLANGYAFRSEGSRRPGTQICQEPDKLERSGQFSHPRRPKKQTEPHIEKCLSFRHPSRRKAVFFVACTRIVDMGLFTLREGPHSPRTRTKMRQKLEGAQRRPRAEEVCDNPYWPHMRACLAVLARGLRWAVSIGCNRRCALTWTSQVT